MSVINTEIKPFKAQAFKDGKFIEVTEADLKGKWGVFFFYPADFTFVCPTELGDVAPFSHSIRVRFEAPAMAAKSGWFRPRRRRSSRRRPPINSADSITFPVDSWCRYLHHAYKHLLNIL